jgi:hypothetical protein
MKIAQVLLTLAIITALPGCGGLVMTYHDVAAWSGRHWSAEKAWRVRRWMYADIPCRGSFKSGFKAGYRFASGGYDSCEPPQLRHYWRIGRLTESERQNAQAWSDGFTHGTVAAQQDHAVGPSALDMAAMQPPEGVPDVRYYVPPQTPTEMGQGGGFQYSPNAQSPPPFQQSTTPGYQFPPTTSENFQYAPNGANLQYSPPPVVPPSPASEAVPASSSPSSSSPVAPLPPPAPASLPAADIQSLPSPMTASEGSPGIGNSPTAGTLQPAPPAEPAPESLPQQQAASPPPQATQAADWEMPLIRD